MGLLLSYYQINRVKGCVAHATQDGSKSGAADTRLDPVLVIEFMVACRIGLHPPRRIFKIGLAVHPEVVHRDLLRCPASPAEAIAPSNNLGDLVSS
jgi:hypothetical protein